MNFACSLLIATESDRRRIIFEAMGDYRHFAMCTGDRHFMSCWNCARAGHRLPTCDKEERYRQCRAKSGPLYLEEVEKSKAYNIAQQRKKEEDAERERKRIDEKTREQERLKKEKEEKKRKAKEEEYKGKNISRVVLKDQYATQVTKAKSQSDEAVYQATRKAAMSDDQKERAKEKDRKRKREERKEESKYETTEAQKKSGAARTAKCRQKKNDVQKKEANHTAMLGMRECKKRKKEDPAAEDGYWYGTPRKKRSHPITRKNVYRKLRCVKETGTYEELITYWHEEKKMFLYMNPSGVHYRRKHPGVPAYANDHNDYEIVHLDSKDMR